MSRYRSITDSPWPHRWAVGLTCATFPLIWVGGLVTTTDAGMAFRDWLTSDGHFMLWYPWFDSAGEKFVEHGHRLLGALVGLLTIGLVAVLWRCEARGWIRGFGVLLLLAVIGQGVLGGMRVLLDERLLAMIHGCTGPLFFAMTVAMAVVASRRWRTPAVTTDGVQAGATLPGERLAALAKLAALVTLVAYVQLVLGARVRHVPVTATPAAFRTAVHLHLGMAAVVLFATGWLFVVAHRIARGEPWILRPARWLCGLVGLQIVLGCATWFVKFGIPHWVTARFGETSFALAANSQFETLFVTAHVACGSAILASALMTTLRSARTYRSRFAVVRFGPADSGRSAATSPRFKEATA